MVKHITDQQATLLSENKYLPFREPTCGTETGFTGRRRTKKASIILMMLFSFEVDTLEISLREIQDVVDHIFIVESSKTHRGVDILKIKISKFSSDLLVASQASGVGKTKVYGEVPVC